MLKHMNHIVQIGWREVGSTTYPTTIVAVFMKIEESVHISNSVFNDYSLLMHVL